LKKFLGFLVFLGCLVFKVLKVFKRFFVFFRFQCTSKTGHKISTQEKHLIRASNSLVTYGHI